MEPHVTNNQRLVEQVLSINRQSLLGVSQEQINQLKSDLATILSWRSETGTGIAPNEIHLIRQDKDIFIAFHWRVYARIASENGYSYKYELITNQGQVIGEKVIITNGSDIFEYPALYEHYKGRDNNEIWQTNFTIMFRKTILKEALNLYCPSLFAKPPFTLTVFYDITDIDQVQRTQAQNTTQKQTPKTQQKPQIKLDPRIRPLQNELWEIAKKLYDKPELREKILEITKGRKIKNIFNVNELLAIKEKLIELSAQNIETASEVLIDVISETQ